MKTFLLVVLFLLGIGSYFYYTNSLSPIPVEITEVTTVEQVVPADTALPQSAPAQMAQFENKDYDFTFSYRIKPYGYSLFENTPAQNIDMGTLFGLTLVRSADYNDSVTAAAEGNATDGPPAMSVYVFTAATGTDLSQWLVQNTRTSNCQEASVMPISVSGEAGASCVWDGLYAGETRAVHIEDRVYLLTGTRENMETADGYSYAKDFMDMVESFTLINEVI